MDEVFERAHLFVAAEEVRAEASTDADGRRHLHGHFAVFDRWTEIDSYREGHFMERIAPGAFAKTINGRANQIKVLFDHGYDNTLGNKPLGSIETLEEDTVGARYDVALIDTDYNRDFIIPAADAGLLGASFRFSVPKDGDEWDDSPKRSADNPDGIKERTITELKLHEFGPVTFPAYQDATVGLRSAIDPALWRELDEEKRAQLIALLRNESPVAATSTTETQSEETAASTSNGLTKGERQKFFREHQGVL